MPTPSPTSAAMLCTHPAPPAPARTGRPLKETHHAGNARPRGTHGVLRGPWLGAACGLLVWINSPIASAIDKRLDLEPPQTRASLGSGYNSLSREFVPRTCVQFAPGVFEDGNDSNGDVFKFSSIISNTQLADDMGLSVATKFSASMGAASASTSSKVDFFRSTTTNFFTHTILASYNNLDPVQYIAGDLTLKREYLALVGTPAFRQQCGDYVIIGEQKGRWFFGTVQLAVRDTLTENKLAVSGLVDSTYGTFTTNVNVSTISLLKQASNTQDLQIRVSSSGTNSASLTIDQFLAQVSAFPGQTGPSQTFKLKAVPFESIVTNWPTTSPLAPMTADDKLARLAEAAWGLTSLISDVQFVEAHAELFALGTSQQKRRARLAGMKDQRLRYQSKLEDLQGKAKNCDVDWYGDPVCESLYLRWKDVENFIVEEYARFPARYTSDCAVRRDITDLQSTLKTALAPTQGYFNRTKGDSEMGGGPVKFSAHLSFRPDFTGGDPLDTRKLLATLNVKMKENKDDRSTFETTIITPVYDLASAYGTPGMSLEQCAYHETGIKTDPIVDEGIEYHGILRGKTREDARTEIFSDSAGALSTMKCTVDSGNHNDTSAIGCTDITVNTVQLDLINIQDLAANKWIAPPKSTPTQIDRQLPPNVVMIDSAYLKLVRSRVTRPKPTNTPTFGVCRPGLVRIGSECVPKLRR